MQKDLLLFRRALEDEIGKKTKYNKDLLEQQKAVGSEIASLPAELRETFNSSAIRDPFAQERIIASRRGGLTAQEGFLNSLLGVRGQRFSDIINNSAQTVGAELADKASRGGGSAGGGFDLSSYLDGLGGGTEDTTKTNKTDTESQKGIDLTKYAASDKYGFDRFFGKTRIKDIGYSVADGNWGNVIKNYGKALLDPFGRYKKIDRALKAKITKLLR